MKHYPKLKPEALHFCINYLLFPKPQPRTLTRNMANMLDSAAVFQSRLKDLGLQSYAAALKTSGIDTLGRLAFITTYQPGLASTDEPFVKSLLKALGLTNESELTPGELSSFRRLWIESSTVAISEMRNRSERTEDQAVKKIPIPERTSRRNAQQARLVGIRIAGTLEPSHSLLDFCQSIRDDNELHTIELAKCTCREQELDGQKREKFFRPDNAGNLKEHSAEPERVADLSSELKVRHALLRRSLALDQVDLIQFEEFEGFHDFLFQLLSQEVPDSHVPISLDQILRADKILWKRMALFTRDGVLPTAIAGAAGAAHFKVYPIMQALEKARSDPVFTSALQPLLRGQRQGPYDRHEPKGKSAKGSGKSMGPGGKGSGKSKGKKSSSKPFSVPQELQGLRTSTSKGYRYCFNFNLQSGCAHAKAGEHCRLGFHGCMKCGLADHGAVNCSKKKE